jgi:MscS family membrane protein
VNDQTLLQIVMASFVLTLYALAVVWIVRQLLQTYGHWGHLTRGLVPAWGRHHVGWYRVALAIPLAPLVEFADVIVDDYVNFTGEPLLVITYVTSAIYYLSCGVFFFYLFEALGRSLSSWLARNSDRNSDLQMRRISTLVVPLGRVLGCFVIVFLIYKLLVDLGASNTVLAFSAVPGLAVGLGASKILGNVFGGLSIQTDRPVRIGEFCRIGGNLGYVTKIGLRSLEMQTLESKVTIPNLIADEQMIVNYSRRGSDDDNLSMQSLDVRIPLEGHFSPEQITDLLALVRRHMSTTAELREPLVSIERADQDRLTVICLATVVLQDWTSYLAVREVLLLRLQELVTQVQLSSIVVGVSYDTTDEQLRRLPDLIRSIVERDPSFVLHCCRLMRISEFSYDFAFRLHSSHSTLDLFQDAIDRLNKDLLACFSAEGIVIPFPTQVEISAAR